eukprot:3030103-Prymnesium_polylepis.1
MWECCNATHGISASMGSRVQQRRCEASEVDAVQSEGEFDSSHTGGRHAGGRIAAKLSPGELRPQRITRRHPRQAGYRSPKRPKSASQVLGFGGTKSIEARALYGDLRDRF